MCQGVRSEVDVRLNPDGHWYVRVGLAMLGWELALSSTLHRAFLAVWTP